MSTMVDMLARCNYSDSPNDDLVLEDVNGRKKPDQVRRSFRCSQYNLVTSDELSHRSPADMKNLLQEYNVGCSANISSP